MAQSRDLFIKALFEQEYKKLVHAAYRMTGSMETAQDLVQDTFLLATTHYDQLSSHPNVEAWLMLTLRNLAWNENRRQQSHMETSLDVLLDLPAADTVRHLDELLPAQLSPEDKKILIWRFEHEISYQEMADRLGISETGCRSRISRAIKKCKKLLGSCIK